MKNRYYKDLNKQYINKMRTNIDKYVFKDIYNNLLDSFLEYYDLFNQNSITNEWYNVLLSRLCILLDYENNDPKNRLSNALELFTELEIKSKEIKKEVKSIFEPIDKKQYKIA